MSRKSYKIAKWNGMDLYQCLQCKHAMLNKEAMEEHVKVHPPLPEIEKPKPRKRKRAIEEPTEERSFRQWP